MVSVTSLPHSENGECAAAPLLISWMDLSLYSKKGKALLGKASGSLSTGFHAIMGPSGAGKSTLLNALAYRLDKGVRKEGSLSLNGQPYSISEVKKVGGYVMQDDLLNGHLTVEETLAYAARLRLPPSFSEEERRQRVEEVIVACNLAGCITTIVGNPLKKGISGGERKRLCVALELLTRPQLLFLDEPTSGLDSVTALSLCTTLHDLSRRQQSTILCTLHQPSAKIFLLFDTLTLLQGGKQVYQGPPADALKYFEEQGFPCPPLTNPADHMMDIISPVRTSSGRFTKLMTLSRMMSKRDPFKHHLETEMSREPLMRQSIPWMQQYRILLERCTKEQKRKWKTLLTQSVQNIVMALLLGGSVFQIGTGQATRQMRLSVIFYCTLIQGMFGATAVMNSFPSERILTLKERAAGMYYASAYFLAKITIDTLVSIITPVLFSCIVYWMVGFQPVASKFFIFLGLMVLCQLAATSLGLAISAICREVGVAVVVLPMALEVSKLCGGYVTPPSMAMSWAVWLDAISYVQYAYIGLALNELSGLRLTCTPEEVAANLCVRTGEEMIQSYGYNYLNISTCAGVLVGYVAVCYTAAYLAIRFLKW